MKLQHHNSPYRFKHLKCSLNFPVASDCVINLDGRTGSKPPLIVYNGDILHPTTRDEKGNRILTIGKTDITNFMF